MISREKMTAGPYAGPLDGVDPAFPATAQRLSCDKMAPEMFRLAVRDETASFPLETSRGLKQNSAEAIGEAGVNLVVYGRISPGDPADKIRLDWLAFA